jgi:poly-gamma-glutamate synthesis protein (capsule biosynthesis protein)
VKVTPAPVPGPSLTPAPTNTGTENADSSGNNPIVLAFAGDVNFNEESKPVLRYDSKNKGILGGLSSGLVKEMKDADLMMLNNEFPYSTRGTKTPDKSYTFRANPDRVEILKEMGVDIVSLANNHSLDYGQDALLDTFTTLDNAGIDYVGAGKNVDRAIAPVYYTVGNKKIAYLAASRVIFAMDWYATDTRPGMIGTYEPAQFLEAIKEAAKNSDYVVVYVHWGVEKENFAEDYQRSLAKKYIDAGADVVVGSHPHVMQNIEFYKGKPIAYSLGNFWFNSNTQYSGLLKVYLNSDGSMRTQLLPVMAENTYSYLLDKENEKKAYFDYMQNLSDGITIDKDGFITEKP